MKKITNYGHKPITLKPTFKTWKYGLFLLFVMSIQFSYGQCPTIATPTGSIAHRVSNPSNSGTVAVIEQATAAPANSDGYVFSMNTVDSFTTPSDGDALPTTNQTYPNTGQHIITHSAGATTAFSVNGLTPLTRYYFKAFAYKQCNGTVIYETTGISGTYTTPGITDNLVTNAVLNNATSTSIDLASFTAPNLEALGNPTGYIVKMNTVDSFTAIASGYNVLGGTAAAVTTAYTSGEQVVYFGSSISPSITITGVTTEQDYYFQIIAYNEQESVFKNQSIQQIPYTFVYTNTSKPTATITFPVITKSQGDANFDLAATSNSGGTINYYIVSQTGGGTSLSGVNNKTVTLGTAGTVVIEAIQSSDATYAATTKTIILTINLPKSSLAFPEIANTVVTAGPTDLTANTTSNSSGVITYEIIGSTYGYSLSGTNNATLNRLATAASLVIRLTQAATANYDETIIEGTISYMTFLATVPAAISFNNFTTEEGMLTVLNVLRPAFVSHKTTTYTIEGGTSTGSVINSTNFTAGTPGTVIIRASTPGDENFGVGMNAFLHEATKDITVTIKETPIQQNITFGALASKAYGDANFTLSAVSDSGLPVSFVSSDINVATISGNTVSIVGAGSTEIIASQIGNDVYGSTITPQTLIVNQNNLDVTLEDKVINVGDADPTLTQTITTGTLVTGDVIYVPLTRTAGTTAGNYVISVDTSVKGNVNCVNNGLCVLKSDNTDITHKYSITPINGIFVINSATGVVWDGSEGTSWTDPLNWSGDAVPNNVDITIPATANMPNVGDGTNGVSNNLNVLSATLTIPDNSSITVNGNLTTNGTIMVSSVGTTSGVLLVSGTPSGMVTYQRGGFTANNWSIVSAPVAGQKIKDFVENAANDIRVNTTVTPNRYAVAYYDDSQAVGSKWVYYDVDFLTTNPNTEFEIGRSYAMSRATDGAVTFTGTLEVADVTKTVIASEWNAIGNPFTAFIAANQNSNNNFIQDNLANFDPLNTAVYVWDPSQSRYVARSLADGTATSLTPGQGFFVRTNTGVTSLSFGQDKRSTQPASGNTSFNRTVTDDPSIQLFAELNGLTIDTNIKYFEHATLGLDPGYDVASFGSNDFDLYTKLLDGYQDTNFTIQSLPTNIDYTTMVIPLGIKASSGEQISFSAEILNMPQGVEVFLEDKILGTLENLSLENASYAITLDQDIDGIGRFYLHAQSSTLSNQDNPELSNIKIFTPDQRTLRINGVEQNAKLKMYTILGAQVLSTSFTGNLTNDIALPYLKTGIYIVQLTTEKGNINKKIIIE